MAPHGSPSLWGAVGNLLPTEGAFLLPPQRGAYAPHIEAACRAAISSPERGISGCRRQHIDFFRPSPLQKGGQQALFPAASSARAGGGALVQQYGLRHQVALGSVAMYVGRGGGGVGLLPPRVFGLWGSRKGAHRPQYIQKSKFFRNTFLLLSNFH